MSLSELYLFAQDFGVCPTLCGLTSLQDTFAVVKANLGARGRTRASADDFVDLLRFPEFCVRVGGCVCAGVGGR